MARRAYAWILLAAPALLVVAGSAASCSSSKAAVGLGDGCSINSDCNNPLVCAFGLCHAQCAQQRDCPSGELCIVPPGGAGVCELPQDGTCEDGGSCKSGLTCSTEGTCATSCVSNASACLGGQTCDTKGACIASGGDGGAPGDGGASGDGGEGGTGDAAPDSSNGCPSAQTTFNVTAQGDTNPNFQSGIGIRTADQILVFDGYLGPDPVGDGGTVNYIYAQAFDVATGNSKGPAAPLLAGPAATSTWYYLPAAAVSPTGEIVLFHEVLNAGIWASFFTDSGNADAGVGALTFEKTVQISTTSENASQVQAFWSRTNNAFVISYSYGDHGPMRVQKFLPGGGMAGGATDPVPTSEPAGETDDDLLGAVVAESNGVYGVGYFNTSNDPSLTALDPSGNEIGGSFPWAITGTWLTLGGTNAGFVAFADDGNDIAEYLIPTSADGGVPSAFQADAGTFSGFQFTGGAQAVYARAMNDDVGGVGGVGLAVLYPSSVDFAYVNADGMTHVGPSSLIAHVYSTCASAGLGDYIHVNNVGGSFAVSLSDCTAHDVQVLVSGCP